MSLPLACLGPQADLLGQEIDRLHGPVTLVRRCADLVELLAVVRSGLALAVMIDEDEPELSAVVIDSLQQAAAVVAVVVGIPAPAGALAGDPGGGPAAEPSGDAPRETGWTALGAVEIPADLPGRQAASALIEASEGLPPPGRTREIAAVSDGLGGDGADTGRELPRRTGLPLDPDDAGFDEDSAVQYDAASTGPGGEHPVPPRGRVVVVWGPHGSPGRSTVAVNLAAECAQQGAAVTLVDLDTWGPSVAALLGLLDETAGVALACRAADRDRLTPDALDRAAVEVQVGPARLTVLTGLTRPERWPELRAGSVQRLLRACQHMPRAEQLAADAEPGAARSVALPSGPAPVIVVDVGFSLEEDEELVTELEAPRRSAATTAALAEADLVLAVCSSEVLGIPRAARSLPALLEATPAPVMLVANRVRRSAAGAAPRSALKEAWAATGAPGQWDAFLSWEPRAVDTAALAGSVLAESAPSCALRGQLRDLAASVLRRLDGDLGAPGEPEEIEDVRGTRLGRALGGWRRR